MSAGLAPDADEVIAADHIEWSDTIFVMEAIHRKRLQRQFANLLGDRKIVVLGIRDEYRFMDSDLVQLLEQRMRRHLSEN